MAKHRWLGNTFRNKSKTGKKYHKNIQRSWIRKRPTKKCDIDLQIKRSKFISQFWIVCFLDPNDFGWKQRDGNSFDIILQDEEDPLFSVPQSLLLGCACKKKCTNKCACIKDSNRYNKCSRITCKFWVVSYS